MITYRFKANSKSTSLREYNGLSSSYLHDRTVVRSDSEIGLLSLRLSVSQGVSLGDFLLALTHPIEKVALWVGFLYLTLGSETDKGVAKDEVFARTRN